MLKYYHAISKKANISFIYRKQLHLYIRRKKEMQHRIEYNTENTYSSSDLRNMFSSTSSTLPQVGNTTGSPPMASTPSSLSRSTSSYASRVTLNLFL